MREALTHLASGLVSLASPEMRVRPIAIKIMIILKMFDIIILFIKQRIVRHKGKILFQAGQYNNLNDYGVCS